MEKLISLDELAKKLDKQICQKYSYAKFHSLIMRYIAFLKRSLKLEMFVPCDEEGRVLKEPVIYKPNSRHGFNTDVNLNYEKDLKQYREAKERVLFKDIHPDLLERIKHSIKQNGTIEILIPFNLTLTKNIIKILNK